MVTQSIVVEGENVDIVAAKIRYLISKTAKLMTMKESNIILVTDYPSNIETIKKVINDIIANSKFIVEVIAIKNTEAKTIKSKLDVIAKTLFNDKVETEKLEIVLDENTNSLITVGTKDNVEKVKALIAKIDVESNAANNGVQIYTLKNSDATSVLKSLTEIISKQTYKDPSMKPNVSASDEINAIIAVGDPIVLKGIKQIIDELDKEKYQVYVQARIIEINKNDAESLGVKYGFDGASLTSNGLYSFSGNFGGAAISGSIGQTMASSVAGNNIGAGSKAFALGAAIDFLEDNGASNSISNPSILCVNNQESSIYVGKTISISSGSTNNAVSGITQNFKREDVGLTLKIKPRVSSIDKVTLNVETILENVLDDGSNNATGQPVTSKQEVKTQAILRHGESIIVGGLVKSYDRESRSQVPILGDIPWLGDWLFGSTSIINEQDNLVVILTPYVVSNSEKLSELQEELGRLAMLQKKYNDEVFKRIEEKGFDALESEDEEIQRLADEVKALQELEEQE
jgi:general secretion pathway protein D